MSRENPSFCVLYGNDCPHDGGECKDRCLLEEQASEEADPRADRGDWEYHQRHDQCMRAARRAHRDLMTLRDTLAFGMGK